MKELTLNRIFPKKEKRLTQLAVYLQGIWSFAALGKPTKVVNNLSIYKAQYTFGLVYEGTSSPDRPPVLGSKGDYIFVDSQGTMSIATPSMYNIMFPTSNLNPPKRVISSKLLSNPKFIDETIKNSNGQQYNNTMSTMQRSNNRPVQPPCNCDTPVSKPCNCN